MKRLLVGLFLWVGVGGIVGWHCVGPCRQDSECEEGSFCKEGRCVYECRTDKDCAYDEYCTTRGRCHLGAIAKKPSEDGGEPPPERSPEPPPEKKPPLERLPPPPPLSDGVEVRVAHVVDGDTLYLTTGPGGWAHSVRLLGVNAPECIKGKSGKFLSCYKDEEYYGLGAYEELKKIVQEAAGKQLRVSCTNVGKSCEKDSFDRYLVFLSLPDGSDMGAEIVRRGAGWSYTKYPCAKMAEYCRLEAQAIQKKAGMWANGREHVKALMNSITRAWYYNKRTSKSHDSMCAKAIGTSFP